MSSITQELFDTEMCTVCPVQHLNVEHMYWAKYVLGFGTYHEVAERGIDFLVAPDGVVMTVEFLFPF